MGVGMEEIEEEDFLTADGRMDGWTQMKRDEEGYLGF